MRTASVVLLTVLGSLTGCKRTQPKAGATPQVNVSPQIGSDQDPTKLNCDGISDPAAAEDCRFRKEVAEDKKKHNSNYVVKHSPGSIKQP